MTEQALTQQNFFPLLIELVPELEPLYREHVTFYKEPVPGIFFASLARIVSDSARNLEGEHSARLEVILDMVDQALSAEDVALRKDAKYGFVDAIEDVKIRESLWAYSKAVLNRELFSKSPTRTKGSN